ncbi:MAG: hypothetical protein M0Q91_17655 [Methanoregula sp.]|nr:hypothetical protein [Methanoregula sp.]
MNSSSVMDKDNTTGAFIEKKCCIEVDGKKFCSGGSWLCQRADNGKYVGILYGSLDTKGSGTWGIPIRGELSSWDGSIKIPAIYGHIYRNNFGAQCRYVWFKYMDRFFVGRWDGIEYSQIVRVREITEKSYNRK